MEHKASQEQFGQKASHIVERVRNWAHDRLTLQGREDAIYLKKYNQITEQLPKDISEQQMALLELRLRNQARSAAVGSFVVDGLFTGAALVGTGVLFHKMAEQPQKIAQKALRRREQGVQRTMKEAKKFRIDPHGAVEAGHIIVRTAAEPVLWPLRQMGRAGRYLWGITFGPVLGAAADLAGAAVRVPFETAENVNWASDQWAKQGEKAVDGVKKMFKRNPAHKRKSGRLSKEMMAWNKNERYKNNPAPRPKA